MKTKSVNQHLQVKNITIINILGTNKNSFQYNLNILYPQGRLSLKIILKYRNFNILEMLSLLVASYMHNTVHFSSSLIYMHLLIPILYNFSRNLRKSLFQQQVNKLGYTNILVSSELCIANPITFRILKFIFLMNSIN